MLIQCNNKSCMQSTEALFDVDSQEVICKACDKAINSVSEPMKRVLKSSGQIVRNNVRKAFTMACMQCYANREVVLDAKGNTICSVCKNDIVVHAAMRLAMEETGTKLKKLEEVEEKQSKPKEKTKKSSNKKTKSKVKRTRNK